MEKKANLEDMPTELMLRVAGLLNTEGLGSLRLTSRLIEETLEPSFRREFFTKRQFMLSERSLQALIDIAQSRLGDSLTNVMIGLDTIETSPNNFGPGAAHRETAAADQLWYITSGQAGDMLRHAFSVLAKKSLEKVTIRSYNSRNRHRDVPNGEWRSYGAAELARLMGGSTMPSDQLRRSSQIFDRAFILVLVALGKASARPDAIEILSQYSSGGISASALKVPVSLEQTVAPVLGNLKMVHLNLRGAEDIMMQEDTASLRLEAVRLRTIERFLSQLRSLDHLRLNLDGARSSKLIDWLGHAAGPVHYLSEEGIPEQPDAIDFPHLVSLDLGATALTGTELLRVLAKFKQSLKRLSLWRITLVSSRGRGEHAWRNLFQGMVQMPGLDLHHIHMHELGYQHGVQQYRVGFKRRDTDPPPRAGYNSRNATLIFTREYTGIDWKHFLEELGPELRGDRPWQRHVPTGSQASTDVQDSEEDDDEAAYSAANNGVLDMQSGSDSASGSDEEMEE